MTTVAPLHLRLQRTEPPARPAEAVHLRDVLGSRALRVLNTPAAYMAHHSRSFRFAAGLLRGEERKRLTRVYAWCRFTDDLVDAASGGAALVERRLDAWLAASREAYLGRSSGVDLVDRVMADMAHEGVPFAYARDLVLGVRSDLHFVPYRDVAALRVYTYRVAGVVGQWLTRLHGEHDPWMLERAASLGHAMQLTNILRDVGEDWDRDRVYLPLSLLCWHGLAPDDIGAMRRGAREIDAAYRNVLEDLMALAVRDYDAAREAIPHLPPFFRRSVAVAAAVYEGIHDAIRRNHYNNVRLRAATTTPRKVALAAGALWLTL